MVYEAKLDSPLGPLLACASERGLRSLRFLQDEMAEAKAHAEPASCEEMPILRETRIQLAQYFAGARQTFSLPLDLVGTPFQQAVWKAVLALPFGATTSYRALATTLGSPSAVRTVGAAIGRNPVAIVVPCHRVLGSGGGLTGYAWGLARKQELLNLESGMQAATVGSRMQREAAPSLA